MPRRTLEERFWEKVDRRGDDECWPWLAGRNWRGYGRFYVGAGGVRSTQAHRVAYELARGPIPEGLVIDHVCENRRCVNPAHLEAVTHLENVRRGRGRALVHPPTHCVNGHPLSASNIYTCPSGVEECRTCRRGRRRAEKAKAKAAGVLPPAPISDEERERRRLAPSNRTHCKHDHPWTPENIYVNPQGARLCRECNRLASRSTVTPYTRSAAKGDGS